MSTGLILVLILIVLLVGGLPSWGYSSRWGGGYGISGVAAAVLIVVVVLWLMGRL